MKYLPASSSIYLQIHPPTNLQQLPPANPGKNSAHSIGNIPEPQVVKTDNKKAKLATCKEEKLGNTTLTGKQKIAFDTLVKEAETLIRDSDKRKALTELARTKSAMDIRKHKHQTAERDQPHYIDELELHTNALSMMLIRLEAELISATGKEGQIITSLKNEIQKLRVARRDETLTIYQDMTRSIREKCSQSTIGRQTDKTLTSCRQRARLLLTNVGLLIPFSTENSNKQQLIVEKNQNLHEAIISEQLKRYQDRTHSIKAKFDKSGIDSQTDQALESYFQQTGELSICLQLLRPLSKENSDKQQRIIKENGNLYEIIANEKERRIKTVEGGSYVQVMQNKVNEQIERNKDFIAKKTGDTTASHEARLQIVHEETCRLVSALDFDDKMVTSDAKRQARRMMYREIMNELSKIEAIQKKAKKK